MDCRTLVLALAVVGCETPAPIEPEPNVTRQQQCREVCVLYEEHRCDKFGVCLEFGQENDEGVSECIQFKQTIDACVDDCVAHVGAYPADLGCPTTLIVTGDDADSRWCSMVEKVCEIPQGESHD